MASGAVVMVKEADLVFDVA